MPNVTERPVMAMLETVGRSLKDGVLAHFHLDEDFSGRLVASQQLKGENFRTAKPALGALDS